MGFREKLIERIRKKEQEIREYEAKIGAARAYIQAMQEAVKLLPREETRNGGAETLLRPGSSAYKAMQALKASDQPLHITEILKAIGLTNSKTNRVSVGGTLSRYARNSEIFFRTAPNTFTLVSKVEAAEPPDDFGGIEEEAEKEGMEQGEE